MAIKRIRAKNFKSFKELDVELGNLNILIGANASGKSNFVEIFKFLRDIKNSGLENAISLQGGVEYLRNINIGSSKILSLQVICDVSGGEPGVLYEVQEELVGVRARRATYEFAIEFNQRGSGFGISKDRLIQEHNFVRLERQRGKLEEVRQFGSGEIILSNVKGKVKIDLNLPEGVPIERDDILPPFLRERSLPTRTLLLETSFPFLFIPSLPLERILDGISIYDFDPKLPKRAVPITGKAELEEDGSNLAIVLKNIVGRKNEKRKLSNLVGDLLPFIDDLGVERFADKSLLFKLREIYSEKQYLPASLISDGTINMVALIIALYFEKKPLTVIEEPERNIHPYLISKVVDMMEDASENKQIIVTTHNPEVIRYANKKDILLISRNEKGFSSICRPSEKEDVKVFLEHGLRMEELYVDSFLEI